MTKRRGQLIKVAMILNSPGFGGVPRVAEALASHLDRNRYEPYFFYLKGLMDDSEYRAGQWCTLHENGIQWDGARESKGKIDVVAQLAGWLQKNDIDIVHTHSYRPNLYGRIAARLCSNASLSIISHYHNQYDDKWRSSPTSLLLEKQLQGVTDAMLAVSDSVRDHISTCVGIDARKIDVVDNGVDARPLSNSDRSAGRRLLNVPTDALAVGLIGRVCHQKGTDLFVDAALAIAEAKGNVYFMIVGHREDVTLHQSLMHRIDQAGLSRQVRFIGHTEAMPSVYAALDLAVAPSRWEGFGLALIEAMAAGVPVLASTAGAIPTLTQNGRAAELLPLNESAELVKAIVGLLSDQPRRDNLSRAGRHRAMDFCWSRSAETLSGVYERVLQAR